MAKYGLGLLVLDMSVAAGGLAYLATLETSACEELTATTPSAGLRRYLTGISNELSSSLPLKRCLTGISSRLSSAGAAQQQPPLWRPDHAGPFVIL